MNVYASTTHGKPAGESCLWHFKKLYFVSSSVLVSAFIIMMGCQAPAIKENVPVPVKDTQSTDQVNIPNTPAGLKVRNHLMVMYGLGPDAENIYQRSLDTLRGQMDESISILVNAYNEVDKIFFGDRWALVQTLADLKGMQALDDLSRIANEPLPRREDTLYDHQISPYNEESIIKITAIKGIGNLAVNSDSAVSILMPFFNHKDSVIRLEALNALAAAIRVADERRKRVLMALLPKDYVFVADIRGINPRAIVGENAGLKPSGSGIGPPPRGN
jgi:hypothetical protein